jgi:hypothetical protein
MGFVLGFARVFLRRKLCRVLWTGCMRAVYPFDGVFGWVGKVLGVSHRIIWCIVHLFHGRTESMWAGASACLHIEAFRSYRWLQALVG